MMLPLKLASSFQRCFVSIRSQRSAAVAAAFLLSAISVRPAAAELIYGIASQAPATALLTWDSAIAEQCSIGCVRYRLAEQ